MIEKDKIYELMDSWERMNSELWDDMFDYEFLRAQLKKSLKFFSSTERME